MVHSNFALVIRSLEVWNIYTATLFRVEEHEFYFIPTGKVEAAEVSADEALSKLVGLCTQCEPKAIYESYGKKKFKTEPLFWTKADEQMQHYVKQLTDKRLNTILETTSRLGIHLFFRESSKNELLKKNELSLAASVAVPQMIFPSCAKAVVSCCWLRMMSACICFCSIISLYLVSCHFTI